MSKEKIKLSNGAIYDIVGIYYLWNLIRIEFDASVDINPLVSGDTSIFDSIQILTRSGRVSGTHENYSTIYNHYQNTIILSNDHSVYTEPVEKPDEPIEIYTPTIDEIKNVRISSLSHICNKNIVDGIDIDINGNTEHFSFTLEDQNNIKNALDLAIQTNMNVPLHCDGGNCKLYTPEQVTSIYISLMTNLTHHQTYFNQMKQYILTLEDEDIISGISYGEALTGEYLDNYNMIMKQTSDIVSKYSNGGINNDC